MRYVLTIFCITTFFLTTNAQSASGIIEILKETNAKISALPCTKGSGNLISNRAMNLFLAGKVGSYLSEESDLSYYKNNITFNSADGLLSLNHNLFQPSGADDVVRSFMVVGVKAGIEGSLSRGSKTTSANQFGFTLRQTWLGKPNTLYQKCSPDISHYKSSKVVIDALRAGILYNIESEINNKSKTFEDGLIHIKSTNVSGENIDSVKEKNRVQFYSSMKDEYDREFADRQAQLLLNTKNYSRITSSWTNLMVYVPLIRERFVLAETVLSPLNRRFAYPAKISLIHTRFIESLKAGRLFLSLGGEVYLNNTASSNEMKTYTDVEYRSHGGNDTTGLAKFNSASIYIGKYSNFVTTSVKGKVVYIPPNWHFGIALMLIKNFGQYNPLNGTIGVPIVLINKNSNPSVNFEFDVHYFDLTDSILPYTKIGDKVSIGITMGVPFSKIIY